MKKTSLKSILYWVPALVWMLVIFLLSNRQSIEVAQIQVVNFLVFKSLHIVEYCTLYLLYVFALKKSGNKHPVLYATYLAIIFALSDEIHQMGVPTREGVFRDIIIDSIGVCFGALIANKVSFFKQK